MKLNEINKIIELINLLKFNIEEFEIDREIVDEINLK